MQTVGKAPSRPLHCGTCRIKDWTSATHALDEAAHEIGEHFEARCQDQLSALHTDQLQGQGEPGAIRAAALDSWEHSAAEAERAWKSPRVSCAPISLEHHQPQGEAPARVDAVVGEKRLSGAAGLAVAVEADRDGVARYMVRNLEQAGTTYLALSAVPILIVLLRLILM
jgi:hypothetical protein